MEEEKTQQHTRTLISTEHHHASSQDDTTSPEKQSRWIVLMLASLLCLAVAGVYTWSTHDILGFILLYGIATGAISVREVVGARLPKSSSLHGDQPRERNLNLDEEELGE